MKPNAAPNVVRPGLPRWFRLLLLSLLLLPVAAFCGFGFLATFEPGASEVVWSWRAVYAGILIGVGIVAVRLGKKPCPHPGRPARGRSPAPDL